MMTSIIRGNSEKEQITLSGDQIAWIASKPDEYKRAKETLEGLIEAANKEKLALSKAKDMDAALKRAKDKETRADEVLKEAEETAESITANAQKSASALLEDADIKNKQAQAALDNADAKANHAIGRANELKQRHVDALADVESQRDELSAEIQAVRAQKQAVIDIKAKLQDAIDKATF